MQKGFPSGRLFCYAFFISVISTHIYFITNRPGQPFWLLSFSLFSACCHFIFPLIRLHRRARARLVSAPAFVFRTFLLSLASRRTSYGELRPVSLSPFPPSVVACSRVSPLFLFPPSGFFRSVSAYRFGFSFSFPLDFVPRGGVVCFRISSIFPSPLPAYTFRPWSTDASLLDSIRSRFEPRRVDSNRKGAGEWSLASDGRRRWNEARSKGLTGKGRGVPETEICGRNDTKR